MAQSAVVFLAAVLCLSGALAQSGGVKPDLTGLGGVLNDFEAPDYKFSYAPIPTYANQLTANTAPVVPASGFTQRLFALKPCQLFIPHFHPNGAELFLGVKGRTNIIKLVNGKLIRNVIEREDAVQVPPNTLHYFYNNGCSEAAVITALNSNATGFQGYYDLPGAILSLKANIETVETLVNTRVSNATLVNDLAFFRLTNECGRKCFLRVKARG